MFMAQGCGQFNVTAYVSRVVVRRGAKRSEGPYSGSHQKRRKRSVDQMEVEVGPSVQDFKAGMTTVMSNRLVNGEN